VLYEKAGDQIAHVKFTVLLQSGGTTKITGLPLPTGFDVRYACYWEDVCVYGRMNRYMCGCMHVCMCVCDVCISEDGWMCVCGCMDVSVYKNIIDPCIQVCVPISEHLYVGANVLTLQLSHTQYKCKYLLMSVRTFLHLCRHRV
jgi:hypothetical protein